MDVTVEPRGATTVVRLVGSVDGLTAEGLQAKLLDQVAGGAVRLVGDLSGVGYTSSAGLRALLATLKAARSQGGDFRLAGVQPAVLKVLELSGFTSILRHFPDVDSAVQSFGS